MSQFKLLIWPTCFLLLLCLSSCPPATHVKSCQCPLVSSENIVLLDSAEIEDISTNSSRANVDSGQMLKLDVELEKQNLKDLKAKGTLILPLDVWGSKRYFRKVNVFSSANASDDYLNYSRWYCGQYLALIDPQNCIFPRKDFEELYKEFQQENIRQINLRFGAVQKDNSPPKTIENPNQNTSTGATKINQPKPQSKAPDVYEVQIEYPIPSDQIESIDINPKPLKQNKGLTCLFVRLDSSSPSYHLSIRSIHDELYTLDFSYDAPLMLKNHFTKNR